MSHSIFRIAGTTLVAAGIWFCIPCDSDEASAFENDRERIRYQQPHDIFYNHYVCPGPCGVPAKMAPSPRSVPPNVGYMYHTYPPLYPHELMYRHNRSWYSYHAGAGWSRTKAYYGTGGSFRGMVSHMRRF